MEMKGTRRSIYFKDSELDLFEFIESKAGNFNFEIKRIIKQVKERDVLLADEITDFMRQLVSDVAEIKNELQNLKQMSVQIALPHAKNNGNEKEVIEVDERDYSGIDDF